MFHDDGQHVLLVRPGDGAIEAMIECLNDKEERVAWCNPEGSCMVVDDWRNIGIDLLTVRALNFDSSEQPWTPLVKLAYEGRGHGDDYEAYVIPSEKEKL